MAGVIRVVILITVVLRNAPAGVCVSFRPSIDLLHPYKSVVKPRLNAPHISLSCYNPNAIRISRIPQFSVHQRRFIFQIKARTKDIYIKVNPLKFF